jgi:hypothetical protein
MGQQILRKCSFVGSGDEFMITFDSCVKRGRGWGTFPKTMQGGTSAYHLILGPLISGNTHPKVCPSDFTLEF